MSNLSNLSWQLPTYLCDSAGGGAVNPDNARFMTSPEPFVLHIVCSILFCVPGTFQLGSALRQRFPRLHRSGGWRNDAMRLVRGVNKLVDDAGHHPVGARGDARLHQATQSLDSPCLCAGSGCRYPGTHHVADDIGRWRVAFLLLCPHGLGLGTEHRLHRIANSPPFSIRVILPRKTL